MGLKLKAFREECTEHLFHLRVMGSVLGLSGNVIAIGSQPARSARNLKVANIEGVSDERLHRGVGNRCFRHPMLLSGQSGILNRQRLCGILKHDYDLAN